MSATNNLSNLRRLHNEATQLQNLNNDQNYNSMFNLRMVGDNVHKWEVLLYGPPDTLYHTGVFKLDISLTNEYPFSPPKVNFVTPIKHVNINKNGDICLDILKTNWSPSQNIKSVIMSIMLLLEKPNFDDPMDADLAYLYKNDEEAYKKEIISCCKKYNSSTVTF